MAAATGILVLLLAVLASRILARLSPTKLPLPLVQVLIGAGLSYIIGFNIRLEPDVFFLILIPPLLFLDGWRLPKNALARDWRPITLLAFGLVIITVLGIGLLVHTLIPAVPLGVAFALAAILSPTDPVAVSAITAGAPIPPRLMHILEGEALFNDASGLVCFRFAVAAVLTGSFSLAQASLTFLEVAAGGLLAGVAIAWGASFLYHWLTRWTGEEPGTPILISILIPSAAYLTAEHLGVSGILAAAAAGISMHYADLIERSSAVTRMRRSAIWEMLQVTLNGTIFVLLGEQLPRILTRAPELAHSIGATTPWLLLAYVTALTLALAVLRFTWVWVSLEAARLRAALHGEKRKRASIRYVVTAAMAGAKGAITLAGILTLPTAMANGTPFPARGLTIFLAMGVVLLTLLTASVGLPIAVRDLQVVDPLPATDKERNARDAAAEAAIQRVQQILSRSGDEDADIWAQAASNVTEWYRQRLDHGSPEDGTGDAQLLADAERRLSLDALAAERDELYRLRLARHIDDTVHRKLVREIDLKEAGLSATST